MEGIQQQSLSPFTTVATLAVLFAKLALVRLKKALSKP
jgi:hypothetical protein